MVKNAFCISEDNFHVFLNHFVKHIKSFKYNVLTSTNQSLKDQILLQDLNGSTNTPNKQELDREQGN